MNHVPPAQVLADLDQDHARIDARLARALDRLIGEGIADFDAAERTVGVALALRDLEPVELLEYATAAVSRLLILCTRCNGEGTVHVTIYGGHEVNCGSCHGTGERGDQ